MTKAPAISDAEWEVMNVFWGAAGPLMANDIVQRLAGTKTWSPRTIKTLLNRLITKGALGFEAQGKSYLYHAAVPRDQCVRAAARSFLSRVFAGSAGPMLIHFVNHADLSAAEVEQLQMLLREKQSDTAPLAKGQRPRKR